MVGIGQETGFGHKDISKGFVCIQASKYRAKGLFSSKTVSGQFVRQSKNDMSIQN